MNKVDLQAAVDAVPFWYHRVVLPHGITTPGWAPIDPALYRIPDDLTGREVLDVGAWDGYWSFEAGRRGAKFVLAIEDFSDTTGSLTNADRSNHWDTFDLCNSELGYTNIRRVECSVYCLDPIARFDTIFCFGVLYHLKHPLLALEKLRNVCSGAIYIETAILDGCRSCYGDYGYAGTECVAEIYPGAEFGRNHSNWHVGTLRYWSAMVEIAGFRNVQSWKLTDTPQELSQARGFIYAEI